MVKMFKLLIIRQVFSINVTCHFLLLNSSLQCTLYNCQFLTQASGGTIFQNINGNKCDRKLSLLWLGIERPG